MNDIGFLFATTVRSNIYLQILINRGLVPSEIVIFNDGISKRMGQARKDQLVGILSYFTNNKKEIDLSLSIFEFLELKDLDYRYIKTSDINSTQIQNYLSNSNLKSVVYSGYGGVIVKKNIIKSGVKLIHAHSGRVPDYRGSTTIYYSILQEKKCHVSVFFLDENIDTGPLLKINEYPKPNNGLIIDYVYDAFIRADTIFDVLIDYNNDKLKELSVSNDIDNETYFIIHPTLKHIAILSCN